MLPPCSGASLCREVDQLYLHGNGNVRCSAQHGARSAHPHGFLPRTISLCANLPRHGANPCAHLWGAVIGICKLKLFEAITRRWGRLDILVHSIAFAPRQALEGRVTDCPRDGFLTAMDVSCWSLLDLTHRTERLITSGGTIFAMSYHGANEVIENYGIMGPVKAALESAVRYLAAELGPKGIRVHAISPGPLATRAASGIPISMR